MLTPRTLGTILSGTVCLITAAPCTAQCPPDRPGSFSASDGSQCNGVALNWSDVGGATNYELWRGRNSNMSDATLIGNPINSQFLDVTALPSITYYYRVRAFRALCIPGQNFSDFSSINAGHRADTPPVPGNVQATDGSLCTGIRVTWNPVAGSPTYDVLRSQQNDPSTGFILNPAPLTGESFLDLTALADRTYFYWVRAMTLCGASQSGGNSGSRGTTPSHPTSWATFGTRCDGILVSWSPEAATPPVTGYRILRGSTDVFDAVAEMQSLPGSVTSYLDTDTQIGVDYYYWVIASNTCGAALGPPQSCRGVCGNPVVITRQPIGQTVASGEVAVFEVEAGGSDLSYRWERNGITLAGATGPRLSIVPAGPTDAGVYRAIVTSPCGSVVSTNAELIVISQQGDCNTSPRTTFTVTLPILSTPPDEEGQGWNRPSVWAGYPDASDDTIDIPNGRPIYALFVSGYAQNAELDQLTFYPFARYLMARGGYVHYAWWNNLLAPYTERPLHHDQSHPGTTTDLTSFSSPALAADKAVPGEDYQFIADARRLLRAIREHNPGAIIIIAGHSMGGGSVTHLAAQADVVLDLVAPIDPVGNRNDPWAGPLLHQGTHFYNWTRWRVTRDRFLGFRSRLLADECNPSGPWLANINDAIATCPAGLLVHDAPVLTFDRRVINLFHRWQNEALFPFDFLYDYTFDHVVPNGGTTSQLSVSTRSMGLEPGGWPSPNPGGSCCPFGVGVCWSTDGHGEIVGFRGPGQTYPLATRVRTSPNCIGCPGQAWPVRTLSGSVWSNENATLRKNLLRGLEILLPQQAWIHEPYNPDLCMVSQELIDLFQSMNKPPTAYAGPDQTVMCIACQTAAVTLDGSGSADPETDTLRHDWFWNFGHASGRIVDIDLPVGTHCITLEVRDPSGHIARDTLTVTVKDASAEVAVFTSTAAAWKEAAGAYEAHAFDEFYPGEPNATRCLLTSPSSPASISLAGGVLTVSAFRGQLPVCAIRDSSTLPAVSDAHIEDAQSTVVFEFEPPATAFYTYFGSLALDRTATMSLFDRDGSLVTTITTPPSTHATRAAGQGFTSTIPMARIEFRSNEPGGVLVGAFVGLRPGEQSLGTVDLGAYNGPDGSGIIELDFAFTFSRCTADFNADGGVDGGDIAAFFEVWESGGLGADFNTDGGIDGADVDAFFVRWEDGC